MNLVTYPRLQLAVTVDERGLIKVWKAENGCKQASCLPTYSSSLEACDFPEGPRLLVSDPALRNLCCFPGSVDLAPDRCARWHFKPGPPHGRPSDQVILLSPPSSSLPATWRADSSSPFGSSVPQPVPWPHLCSLSPSQRSSPVGCLCFLVHGPLLSCLLVLLIVFLLLAVPSHYCILTLLSPFSSLHKGPTERKTEAYSTECKHLLQMMKAFCCQDICFRGDSWALGGSIWPERNGKSGC